MSRRSLRPYAEALSELTSPGGEFEMRTIEISGRPTRVWANSPRSLREVVGPPEDQGSVTFLVMGDQRWTFDRHYRSVCALAAHLVDEVGIRPGERVAIAMRNRPEWSVAFWATVAIGGVAVPLNSWWTSPELGYALDDSGAVAAVVDHERMGRIARVRPGRLRQLLVTPADTKVAAGTPTSEETFPPGVELLETVLVDHAGPEVPQLPPAAVRADDTATIFYTSGTTGRPKGVVGTHRNMCTNLLSRAFWRASQAVRSGVSTEPSHPVILLTVPLFHVTGCHSYLFPALASKSTLVLMERWDPQRALRLIARERVSSMGGVPTTAMQLMDAYRAGEHDLSSLVSVAVGGAQAPPELFRRLREILPKVVAGNGYGMTETSSVAIYNFGADCLVRPESIGRLVPVMDARVVGADGRDAPRGSPGELWLRGPNVTVGYWRRPEETAAASAAEGWLKTGDLVEFDDEGFFTLVGRLKDLIVRGGENVSPSEIEAVLFAHPGVADAAVFGIAHSELGEEVAAVVCLKEGEAVAEDELTGYLRARLAHFKVPAHLHIVAGPLPRNPQGKLLRGQLQATFDLLG